MEKIPKGRVQDMKNNWKALIAAVVPCYFFGDVVLLCIQSLFDNGYLILFLKIHAHTACVDKRRLYILSNIKRTRPKFLGRVRNRSNDVKQTVNRDMLRSELLIMFLTNF